MENIFYFFLIVLYENMKSLNPYILRIFGKLILVITTIIGNNRPNKSIFKINPVVKIHLKIWFYSKNVITL